MDEVESEKIRDPSRWSWKEPMIAEIVGVSLGPFFVGFAEYGIRNEMHIMKQSDRRAVCKRCWGVKRGGPGRSRSMEKIVFEAFVASV
jgi:hypothetical protein